MMSSGKGKTSCILPLNFRRLRSGFSAVERQGWNNHKNKSLKYEVPHILVEEYYRRGRKESDTTERRNWTELNWTELNWTTEGPGKDTSEELVEAQTSRRERIHTGSNKSQARDRIDLFWYGYGFGGDGEKVWGWWESQHSFIVNFKKVYVPL